MRTSRGEFPTEACLCARQLSTIKCCKYYENMQSSQLHSNVTKIQRNSRILARHWPNHRSVQLFCYRNSFDVVRLSPKYEWFGIYHRPDKLHHKFRPHFEYKPQSSNSVWKVWFNHIVISCWTFNYLSSNWWIESHSTFPWNRITSCSNSMSQMSVQNNDFGGRIRIIAIHVKATLHLKA